MRITVGMLLMAAALATGSSCARPDWIDRTLVTVDVTGVWFGASDRGGGTGTVGLWLDLQQEGSKVRGYARPEGMVSRSIEGTIAGDVFSIKGSSGGAVSGELTVSGDEMTGEMFIQGSYVNRFRVLHRVEPSSRPASQPR
jgi:hypothetical protein